MGQLRYCVQAHTYTPCKQIGTIQCRDSVHSMTKKETILPKSVDIQDVDAVSVANSVSCCLPRVVA